MEDIVVFKTVDIEVIGLGLEHVALRVVWTVLGHHICHFGLGDIDISFSSMTVLFLSVAFPICGLHQVGHFACSKVGTLMFLLTFRK